MKKVIAIGLALTAGVNASNINDVIAAGNVSGQLRLAYIDQNNDAGIDTYATSLGGQLKYETGSWNNLKLGVAAYVSGKLPFASGSGDRLNPDFFDTDGKSFVYLGEAYIDYTADDITLRVGRQQIETPYMETDDVRMLPNSFEAAIATYRGFDNTTLVAGYARRWAGYDSPTGHNDSLNEFKKFGENHDSNGLYLLGATNESLENLAVQGWIYVIDQYSDIAYADAVYTINLSETASTELCGQYAYFDEDKDTQGNNTGVDGQVYGAGINVNMGMVTLNAAYNHTSNTNGKFITNGLGGGPYYTSMEEMTIDGMSDAVAYAGGATLDLASLGAEGLSIGVMGGVFKSSLMDADVRELDMVAAYDISETVSCDVSYAQVDDRKNNFDAGNDAGYSRFLARINYNF